MQLCSLNAKAKKIEEKWKIRKQWQIIRSLKTKQNLTKHNLIDNLS